MEAARFYDNSTYWDDHTAQEYRIPIDVFENIASWTPQFLQHWLPEPYQWFVLVMHKMCFQGGINAPLKDEYYLDSLHAKKNKTKHIQIATN
jgi:hypothetical protein